MTAYFKPPKISIDGPDNSGGAHPNCQNILPNFRVECLLDCSTFVLEEEVALIDRFLGAEIAALFEN